MVVGRHAAVFSLEQGYDQCHFTKPVDGSEDAELIIDKEGSVNPFSWSRDGNFLVFYEISGQNRDIWTYSAKDGSSTPFVVTGSNERAADFSPDGKWIVYASDASGRDEVYVKAFPGGTSAIQVTNAGGTEPVWSPDGKEIFYRTGDTMMSAAVETVPSFRVVKREELFEGQYRRAGFRAEYDVHPDGDRFLMVRSIGETAQSRIVLVVNWFEELKRLAPTGK